MKNFDVLIIGGSAAGLSCALILGSAKGKPFAEGKEIGIVAHQKASALNNAELNNVLGFKKGTKGTEILNEGLTQLSKNYSHIEQIHFEKVIEIKRFEDNTSEVITNKNSYKAKIVVIAVGPSKMINIVGLEQFVESHIQMPIEKDKIMLRNFNHLIDEGLYVAGIIAGWRSQYAIAAGSGAQVGTDILTLWNEGKHTMIHDVIE
ncbi:Pyridine nucleotide-disulphide oxidoreductase [Lutibacter oricola]|uniref:Pyridine nucleotide-disulphide oxidoreductase n=1 Tax=Lutibacter oricola TaxID=762486 RepID=A0A1H2R7Y3_9FLAO|nr:FAD-dependent oxidoreductase [Lutibacter oricola]SDW15507.1 Pyridine nucleotide-disulphide oxidoreductase [Lutibacter oricola]